MSQQLSQQMTKVLAGNWKMHKTRAETREFFLSVGSLPSKVTKIVATSPTLLETAVAAAQGTGVEIYSQNCAWELQGAFTGEISALQLKELGVRGALVGHSERRQYFGESDETCQKRASTALAQGLGVIYCIGESLKERNQGETQAVIARQMKPILELRPTTGFMVAYEPVWAIGTGVVATTAQVEEAHRWIAEMLKTAGLPAYPVLYGGSVKPSNFKELASLPNVAGGLVGGASLEAKSFTELHAALL